MAKSSSTNTPCGHGSPPPPSRPSHPLLSICEDKLEDIFKLTRTNSHQESKGLWTELINQPAYAEAVVRRLKEHWRRDHPANGPNSSASGCLKELAPDNSSCRLHMLLHPKNRYNLNHAAGRGYLGHQLHGNLAAFSSVTPKRPSGLMRTTSSRTKRRSWSKDTKRPST